MPFPSFFLSPHVHRLLSRSSFSSILRPPPPPPHFLRRRRQSLSSPAAIHALPLSAAAACASPAASRSSWTMLRRRRDGSGSRCRSYGGDSCRRVCACVHLQWFDEAECSSAGIKLFNRWISLILILLLNFFFLGGFHFFVNEAFNLHWLMIISKLMAESEQKTGPYTLWIALSAFLANFQVPYIYVCVCFSTFHSIRVNIQFG